MKKEIENVEFSIDGSNILFKIDNETGKILNKSSPKGLIVFFHKDYQSKFQREKNYIASGRITSKPGQTCAFFVPTFWNEVNSSSKEKKSSKILLFLKSLSILKKSKETETKI